MSKTAQVRFCCPKRGRSFRTVLTALSFLVSATVTCQQSHGPLESGGGPSSPYAPQNGPWSEGSSPTSASADNSYIYRDTLLPCIPWKGAGAHNPVNYTPTQPAVTVSSAADSGAGTLRAAITRAAAGATIGFAAHPADSTIRLRTELALTRNVTIDIDAQRAT
jgi:hypothetical protein